MWFSRLFWKLFLVYGGLTLASTVAFVTIVGGWQQTQVTQQAQRRLHDAAAILKSRVEVPQEADHATDYQALTRHLGKETGMRMTLIAQDGEVIADSREDPSEMENHAGRPELLQAAAHGSGDFQRVSPTLEEPMLYYALSTEEGPAGVAFVRVALPMTSIYREVARIKRLVWLVALGVGVVVLLVTYWIVARIVRPVGTLTEAAEVLARGDFSERIYLPGSDELATLGRAFNRMSDEQSARVAQLRASNDRLETVLSSMIEGVVAVDDSLCILFANSAAGRLLNFDARQAEGRPLLETIRNHTLYEAISDLFTDPKPLSFEFKSGQHPQRVLAVNAAPLTRDPSPGVVLVLHDMTELRKLETHRQEFVANVSHELKTPLAAIKAYAETLLDGALADPHNNVPFVRRIDEQANRLHQLILDLLSLARIESGEAGFEIGVVDLEPLIEASITQYQQAATAKGMNLQRAQDCPGLTVRADEEGMRQILGNLIDNAIKYTPAGGSVTVSWRSEAQDAVIEVADTGIGIAPDDQARLFERFYRVDRARSRELGGTGLGLSIVKHLAQAFSGEVSVRSEPGKGSTFSVRLPLATSGAGAMPR